MFTPTRAFKNALHLLIVASSASLVACAGGGATNVVPSSTLTASASSATPVPAAARRSTQGTTTLPTETPVASDIFGQSVGVNAHMGYWGTAYTSNTTAVQTLIKNLGVRHVRDVSYPGDPGACAIDASFHAMDIGVLTVVNNINYGPSDIKTIVSCLGPALEAFEGPNEYDLTHPSSDTNWAATLANYQRMLYSTVKSLTWVPVIAPALTTATAYAATGSLVGYVDLANVHDYFSGHNPGSSGYGATYSYGTYGSLPYFINMSRQNTGTVPLWSTETGFGDQPGDLAPVSPTVKMHYILRTVLEQYNAGIAHTYLYQFVDAGGDEYNGYGLVDANLNPKPAYYAIKNLLAHVRDYAIPATTPLAYAISAPSSVHHLLLRRGDGTYTVILWNDVAEWDCTSSTPIVVPPVSTTLTLANAPSSVSATTFDNGGNVSTASLPAQASFSVSVDGSATIVDIKP